MSWRPRFVRAGVQLGTDRRRPRRVQGLRILIQINDNQKRSQ